MADYDNTNKGVAFTNDFKKEDRHPDWKGKGNFNGVEFEFGVWERISPKGRFLSFSFSEPYQKPESEKTGFEVPDKQNIDLNDIPF